MMRSADERWVEVSPSQFPHEAEGLGLVRAIMPDESPFRAWSNFEFRDSRGRWHEVDLLLLGRGRLHLIELKYYAGTLHGDDHNWLREGRRPEESPLKLARRKSQYFASKLKDELRAWATQTKARIPNEKDVIPFVQEAVFLHHPTFRSLLSPASAINLYGPDGAEAQTNLPSVSDLVLEPAGRRAIGPNQEQILVALMRRIGLVQRREREAGSWVIEDEAIDSDEGWQDWLASHKFAQQERARIRFQVAAPSAGEQARKDVRRIAEHEFRVMSRLQHDGLLRPRDLVESELGVGLVYPYDPDWQRLDLWLAGEQNGVPLATQLSMIRQIGEALQYAHGNKVVHRGLSPKAVWVRPIPGTANDVKVRVGDWQGAGAVEAAGLTHSVVPGVTSLFGATPKQAATPTGQSQVQATADQADSERWLTDTFRAPEGAWNPTADRVRLDVFGLGALAFYLLTQQPPAPSANALKMRLNAQQGLDVAIELPQISSHLRSLVLKATQPAPTQRTPDVATFLAQLATAERETTTETPEEDPLEATPGTILDGRFRLERRLGQGSTAVGLLVTDLHTQGTDTQRVLKVSLNADAAARLTDEAEVLRGLNSPRVVKLIDGPLAVGGRQALLLENAGPATLNEVLRARDRLSLDLLERFGADLLECLVALDKAGIDHRDIKPSNLGVRENRGDRTKHLVLFDFSLTRAAASATSAGTPPYLDPFLIGERDRFDSAAERYSAAVVLFEMATGATPVYGDGQADPASITDEATIEPQLFDPALASLLADFFRTALARDASARHHTAESMRAAWLEIFAGEATTEPAESNDELARQATLATPLVDSGLTARALSALEPYAVHTVGELLTVDPVRLSRLQGVANSTRQQIRNRMKEWRSRLGDDLTSIASGDGHPKSPGEAAELLISTVASGRPTRRAAMVRLVLGVGTDLDAFATRAQLAANLPEPVTPARASQLLTDLQEKWAADDAARSLLDRLADAVSTRLTELGTIATPAELATAILQTLGTTGESDNRLVRGLLRFALERRRALHRADGSADAVWLRRRAGIVALLAEDQALFDVAESLGSEADALVDAAGDATRALIPAARATARLVSVLPGTGIPAELADPMRLVRLGAAMSSRAAASGAGELHHRDLSQVAALELSFKGFGGGQRLGPEEIRERVRVRFPSVTALAKRPTLDALVQDAGLGLVFDDRLGVYRSPELGGATTGLESRKPTALAGGTSPVASTGAAGARLEGSIASRSFLALGVRADRLARFVHAAQDRYAANVVDVTEVLLDALRSASAEAGLPWELVRAADAEGESSRGRRGLNELVKRSWSRVEEAIDTALAVEGPDAPVLLTEASPLARYDNVGLLARWTDLGASRAHAVWLVVPQLGGNHGALLDGRPVPLAAPSQFVALDNDWIDNAVALTAAEKEL
jgi:serine/threonine protein kinase